MEFKINHGFFTKYPYKTGYSHLINQNNKKKNNYSLKQIHSNIVVLCEKFDFNNQIIGDGIISQKPNQNLWVYTADCMPILFADKLSRRVGAIHCGRKGLERRIIKKTIKIFENLGSSKKNLIVAIGPSISKKNYFLDQFTLKHFHKNMSSENNSFSSYKSNHQNDKFKFAMRENLNLRKLAFEQLIDKNINFDNINVTNICTFELSHEFYSWRKSKTLNRNWNFISS